MKVFLVLLVKLNKLIISENEVLFINILSMKKILLVWLLSIFSLSLFGCNHKTSEDSVVLPPTNDELLNFAAEALPCDEWTTFANFALLWTGVSRQWNLMYYGVDEVMGFLPVEDGKNLRNTCYRIAPVAMEISQSDKWFKLVNAENAEMDTDFLIEDYNPEFDWWKLDDAVKAIFSPNAFSVWQQRDYWEYFPDYYDVNRKTFDERATEYFGIEAPESEEFISYYDNWSIREIWTYINEMKEWTWITYDEEWNIIDVQEYINWNILEYLWLANYTILWPDDWFEKERSEWTLVLKANYEDHTDYIFLTQWMREGFLDWVNAWEEVIFQWKVYSVDWAAWSHYYNAEWVEQLELSNAE